MRLTKLGGSSNVFGYMHSARMTNITNRFLCSFSPFAQCFATIWWESSSACAIKDITKFTLLAFRIYRLSERMEFSDVDCRCIGHFITRNHSISMISFRVIIYFSHARAETTSTCMIKIMIIKKVIHQ